MDTLRVALVQAPPVFLDLPRCVTKAETLLREAAAEGAGLVVFPETWLPGYPLWLDEAPAVAVWDHEPSKALFRCLLENSPALDGPEIATLRKLAGELEIDVVFGIHERDGNSLYNTMLFITDRGRGLALHRKLVPTFTERLVWGRGDGSTLPVIERPWGRLGGLVCWEHWMPLARAAMHAQHETVHVAQWPWVKEMHQIASRQYAFEGRCFVLASGCRMSVDDVKEGFEGVADRFPAADARRQCRRGPGRHVGLPTRLRQRRDRVRHPRSRRNRRGAHDAGQRWALFAAGCFPTQRGHVRAPKRPLRAGNRRARLALALHRPAGRVEHHENDEDLAARPRERGGPGRARAGPRA